ncbi:MAG TPA: prepilin-type N-terminal cleavage/methylation domain-containing protein [Oligoflexia bacterium]|nr:prepilin-type N-terminal cleavage/methylation domain-containing protein [Oligoflexia bacterium]HMR23759.1 prepilin-type N-terminal cleavage/methylation domain-containing protein [Oligoflexia bacterium]
MKTLNINHLRKGFSLVEAMTAILIVGILATVGVPQYRKYIADAYKSEGLLLLRKVVDSQTLYYKTQPFLHQNRTLMCQPNYSFAGLSTYWSDSKTCNGRTTARHQHPLNQKKYICFFQSKLTFNSTDCLITSSNRYNANNKFLGEYVRSQNATYNIFLLDPTVSKFTAYAGRDSWVQANYGVPLNQTLTVRAVADTDGDSTHHSYTRANVLYNSTYNPLLRSDLWVLQRSMYANNGELNLTSGIFEINPGE